MTSQPVKPGYYWATFREERMIVDVGYSTKEMIELVGTPTRGTYFDSLIYLGEFSYWSPEIFDPLQVAVVDLASGEPVFTELA